MYHLDVPDAPWRQDDDQMIEDHRKARGCYVCSQHHFTLEEAVPLAEYLCPNCGAAYRLGLKHGQRQTEDQLLEHDPQW